MKILFIGGTKFVGRQMVEDAVASGHDVYLLQRGKTNLDLFQKITKYIGDRFNISELIPKTEIFDLVVDTCGYHPHVVMQSCQHLKDKAKLYAFISTGSVYDDFSKPGLNEESATSLLSNIPSRNDPITGENYGPLKALCEKVVIDTFGLNKSLILRPCIIVGAHDDSKRFDYWISAIVQNKSLEIPDDNESNIQFIDVRAISDFVLGAIENNRFGIFNLIGPKDKINFIDFIYKAKSILNLELEINPIDPKSKAFPMYVNDEKWNGFFNFDGSKAYKAGLKEIKTEDTIKYVAKYLKREIQ